MTRELYALGEDRAARFALAFLDHFLPDRRPSAVDYPVPEVGDAPEVVFETDAEILEYLGEHSEERYGLYWDDATPGSFAQAMLFYTRDGHVIFGLAVNIESPAERLRELAAFVGADYALVGWEAPPPDTSAAFMALCRRTQGPSITPTTKAGRR